MTRLLGRLGAILLTCVVCLFVCGCPSPERTAELSVDDNRQLPTYDDCFTKESLDKVPYPYEEVPAKLRELAAELYAPTVEEAVSRQLMKGPDTAYVEDIDGREFRSQVIRKDRGWKVWYEDRPESRPLRLSVTYIGSLSRTPGFVLEFNEEGTLVLVSGPIPGFCEWSTVYFHDNGKLRQLRYIEDDRRSILVEFDENGQVKNCERWTVKPPAELRRLEKEYEEIVKRKEAKEEAKEQGANR